MTSKHTPGESVEIIKLDMIGASDTPQDEATGCVFPELATGKCSKKPGKLPQQISSAGSSSGRLSELGIKSPPARQLGSSSGGGSLPERSPPSVHRLDTDTGGKPLRAPTSCATGDTPGVHPSKLHPLKLPPLQVTESSATGGEQAVGRPCPLGRAIKLEPLQKPSSADKRYFNPI